MQSRISLSPSVLPGVTPDSPPEIPVPIHPNLLAILPRLQLVHDCWDLLNNQKEYYLPRGEREPDSAYKRRIDAALPSGFFMMRFWEDHFGLYLVFSNSQMGSIFSAKDFQASSSIEPVFS